MLLGVTLGEPALVSTISTTKPAWLSYGLLIHLHQAEQGHLVTMVIHTHLIHNIFVTKY